MLDFNFEEKLINNYKVISGIDEAGRGPWAGPLVVAGVEIDINSPRNYEVNDSKKISARKREEIASFIINNYKYHIEIIDNKRIDQISIGKAIIEAIHTICINLNSKYYIIDGYFKKEKIPANTECIIKGDSLHYSIAAASILAKVTRDNLMIDFDKIYPEYNFARNKGYGTKDHIEAIKRYGICDIHRKSYKPIKEYINYIT